MKYEVDSLKKELVPTMSKEVSVLRELLSTTVEEQKAILMNDPYILNMTLYKKDFYIGELEPLKDRRKNLLKSISSQLKMPLEGIEEENAIFFILQNDQGPDGCQLVLIREQILALIEKIKTQTERNAYLLKEKIHLNQKVMDEISPRSYPTYSMQGTLNKKKQMKTLTLINEEG